MHSRIPFVILMLTKRQRTLSTGVALILLFAALRVIWAAGLPDRVDYTGNVIGEIGRIAPEIGALAPPIDASQFSGEDFSLWSLRGQSVIVNFWATWCLPCRTEMPELQTIHERGSAHVVGVNIGEARAAIEAWTMDLDLTFAIVPDPDGQIYADYRVRAQPTTIVIDGDGIITHIFFGATSANSLESALQSH